MILKKNRQANTDRMTRIHIAMPDNMIALLDQMNNDTGVSRAEAVRRLVIKATADEYPQFYDGSYQDSL